MHKQLQGYKRLIEASRAQLSDRSKMRLEDQILADVFVRTGVFETAVTHLEAVPEHARIAVLESKLDQVNAGIYSALIDHIRDDVNEAMQSEAITDAFALKIPLYEYDRAAGAIYSKPITILLFEFKDPKDLLWFKLAYGTELNEFPEGFEP